MAREVLLYMRPLQKIFAVTATRSSHTIQMGFRRQYCSQLDLDGRFFTEKRFT